MMGQRNSRIRAILFAGLLAFGIESRAGIWDDPSNLKILPEDISPNELRWTMRFFAGDTGSKCSDCHVAEDPENLKTFDFSLDDKEKKRKARLMIKMVNDINAYLAESLGKPADELVTVSCGTCHRGQAKPLMIQDVLERAYRGGGFESAAKLYRKLRERFYGGFTYDFSEMALTILAEQLADQGDPDGALQFLDFNLIWYPDSARTVSLEGQVMVTKGDIPAARERYLKALEMDPGNKWVQFLLDKLDED